MYIVIFNSYGMRCEILYSEEEAKETYKELSELFSDVHLLKVKEEIFMKNTI